MQWRYDMIQKKWEKKEINLLCSKEFEIFSKRFFFLANKMCKIKIIQMCNQSWFQFPVSNKMNDNIYLMVIMLISSFLSLFFFPFKMIVQDKKFSAKKKKKYTLSFSMEWILTFRKPFRIYIWMRNIVERKKILCISRIFIPTNHW